MLERLTRRTFTKLAALAGTGTSLSLAEAATGAKPLYRELRRPHEFALWDKLPLIPVTRETARGDIYWVPANPLFLTGDPSGDPTTALRPYCRVERHDKVGLRREREAGYLPRTLKEAQRALRIIGTALEPAFKEERKRTTAPEFPPGGAHYEVWIAAHVVTYHGGLLELSYAVCDRVLPRALPALLPEPRKRNRFC